VVSVPIPSEAAQLAFLRNVQRLLEEGQFTATYKFALLGILEQAQAHAATLADLRRNPKWEPLLKQVARQVELMPLLKLQTLRGDRKLLFLYQEEVKEGAIELLPGVAFCLRRFSGFLRTLAHAGWSMFLLRRADECGVARRPLCPICAPSGKPWPLWACPGIGGRVVDATRRNEAVSARRNAVDLGVRPQRARGS